MAVPSSAPHVSEPSFALSWEHARSTGETRRAGRQMLRQRFSSFSISRYVTTETGQTGGIKWLDLDTVEQRYLLTAAADTTVEAFDILTSHAASGGHQQQHLKPVFTLKRGHPSAHRYQVTSICWYPIDTGLFVTGSADHHVKVWDTNMLEVACEFDCPDKVICVSMSSCATSHALVAVGTKNPLVQLADVVSGGFTHTLTGHRTGVWSVCWSPANEHHIYTGDASGEVRLWDVRRSGCQAMLDMNTTQRPRPVAALVYRSQVQDLIAHPVSLGATRDMSARSADTSTGSRPRKRHASGEAADGEVLSNNGNSPASAARPLSHEGPVTGIVATADGLNLVTVGADNRARLWDSQYHHNRLVHFADIFNRGAYPKRLSCTPDGRYLFCPRGDDVQVFDIALGQQITLLSQGHYDTVTACVYSPLTNQLYSCGIDGALLAWEPWNDEVVANPQQQQYYGMDYWLAAAAGRRVAQLAQSDTAAPAVSVAADVDAWSEDDEYELN